MGNKIDQEFLDKERKKGCGYCQGVLHEVRSFEVDYVHGLWHLDFHHGSRKILCKNGQWHKPLLLAILDDHSRLICHAQWYLDETVESLVHGFMQALQKRGLPPY